MRFHFGASAAEGMPSREFTAADAWRAHGAEFFFLSVTLAEFAPLRFVAVFLIFSRDQIEGGPQGILDWIQREFKS